MNWVVFLGAVANWIRAASTVQDVEQLNADRSFDGHYHAEYVVNTVEDVNDLTEAADYTGADPIFRISGVLRVTMTVAFISHTQEPRDFALYFSELMRVRAKLESVRAILRAADASLVSIGPTINLEELRDDHIFSRAEVSIVFEACVNYTSDPTLEFPEPVERAEVTTDFTRADAVSVDPDLQLVDELIPIPGFPLDFAHGFGCSD